MGGGWSEQQQQQPNPAFFPFSLLLTLKGNGVGGPTIHQYDRFQDHLIITSLSNRKSKVSYLKFATSQSAQILGKKER